MPAAVNSNFLSAFILWGHARVIEALLFLANFYTHYELQCWHVHNSIPYRMYTMKRDTDLTKSRLKNVESNVPCFTPNLDLESVDNKSQRCYRPYSQPRPTVISPDYNMIKQLCIKHMNDITGQRIDQIWRRGQLMQSDCSLSKSLT